MNKPDDQQVDRLAHAYRLNRSMYYAALEVAGEHFAGLVSLHPILEKLRKEVEQKGVTLPGADDIYTCALEMLALEDRLLEHEAEALEAIQAAGHGVAPVVDTIRLLHKARKEIATQLAPTIACNVVSDADALLVNYASHTEDELAEGRPLVGFVAYQQRDDRSK